MTRSRVPRVGLLVLGLLLLASCAAGPNDVAGADAAQTAGFWLGLWHGVIYPVTFVVSLFNDGVNIYEVHNNGNWYDFGFVLGAGVITGGFLGGSRSSRRNQ